MSEKFFVLISVLSSKIAKNASPIIEVSLAAFLFLPSLQDLLELDLQDFNLQSHCLQNAFFFFNS